VTAVALPTSAPTFTAAPPPALATSQPVVAAPALDGTYRMDDYNSKETVNGQLEPTPSDNGSTLMGLRSSCTSAGCVATGTALDSKNLQAPITPAINYVLHWINGRWQSDDRTDYQTSCAAVGPNPGMYNETSLETMSFEPQPDGSYRGTTAWTIQTNECGLQGTAYVVPFAAWRTGPPPAGVVADPPSTVTAAPTTATAAPTTVTVQPAPPSPISTIHDGDGEGPTPESYPQPGVSAYDAAFLGKLRTNGWVIVDAGPAVNLTPNGVDYRANVLHNAHKVCYDLSQGVPASQVNQGLVTGAGMSAADAPIFASSAQSVYPDCSAGQY